MRGRTGQVGRRFAALLGGLALALATVIVAGAEARTESRIALVIGNDRYAHLDADRQLEKAVNDAEAVGDALQRDGFTVLRGMNLSRPQMVDKLYDLSALLKPGDTAVFYFAGHGVGLSAGNYLIPSDIPDVEEGQENRLSNQAIAEADVIATLQEKGARVSVIIIDACRDNPFRRPGLRSVGLERGMTRLPESSGVFSLYSAGYGQSALDRLSNGDTNPNSVFTRVLLPLMTKPGLNLDDLAYEVREDVAHLAATTPDHHEQIPAAYNQIIGGRVYLAPASASPTSAASDPKLDEPKVDPPSTVAALPPSPAAPLPADVPVLAALPAPSDKRLLALALQAELNRLGCDAGPASGDWSPRSRTALLRFSRLRHLTLSIDKPEASTLDLLRQQASPACPHDVRHTPPRSSALGVHRSQERVAQRVVERRIVSRSQPARREGPRPAGGCFTFGGQQVCE